MAYKETKYGHKLWELVAFNVQNLKQETIG